ncbi:tetraprenyl-beta-curcumene synthase family protein [Paenibacillus sp. CC-CFT747]|nr:tetraprenyl-beta-curcumene synthase family protein [Paenibacillus sp. CC-CFT747]
MYRVYRFVLPSVRTSLKQWREEAERIPDEELRRQALASLATKAFHCQGGAVYAAAGLHARHDLIPLIVAFQTISDYLDNLCDRSTSLDPEDFRSLHEAMLDAVDPERVPGDYYAFRSEKEDGGYLRHLVETCRQCIGRLPSYSKVQAPVIRLVRLYVELQVHKHIRRDLREQALLQWWEKHKAEVPGIYWNEFAAAAGSTLGVFLYFLAAADPDFPEEEANIILEAYFPYVCALHILLDYLIDQEEDRAGGDLNFCFYYRDMEETAARVAEVAERAKERIDGLKAPAFHRMIIEGLLALYLSDPKVKKQSEVRRISRALMKNSPLTRVFFWVNSMWIRSIVK